MATIKNETNKQKRTALDCSFLVFTKDLKNAVWYVARISTCKGCSFLVTSTYCDRLDEVNTAPCLYTNTDT